MKSLGYAVNGRHIPLTAQRDHKYIRVNTSTDAVGAVRESIPPPFSTQKGGGSQNQATGEIIVKYS